MHAYRKTIRKLRYALEGLSEAQVLMRERLVSRKTDAEDEKMINSQLIYMGRHIRRRARHMVRGKRRKTSSFHIR